MRRFRFASGVAVFTASFWLAMPLYAAPDAASVLSDQEIDARLNVLTQTLQAQQPHAQYWEYGWGAFDASTLIWSATQAGRENDPKNRKADTVQAGESLIGLADVIFRPLPAFNADALCREPIYTRQDKLDCLAEQEDVLERSAERAEEPYELLPHAENLGFNLLAGLLVKRLAGTPQAMATAIPGEIIGEIQLWTIPWQPIADGDQYKMRFSPLMVQADHSKNPATGVVLMWGF